MTNIPAPAPLRLWHADEVTPHAHGPAQGTP